MTEKLKNYFGVAIIVALFLFAFSAVSYVKTYSKSIEPSSFRSFSVTGQGKVVAVPDVAQFAFSVITEGGVNLTDLQTRNTEAVNATIEFIKAKEVDAKDIKTQTYNVTPRYLRCTYPRPIDLNGARLPCPPPEIVGYTVQQSVLVKVRDFEKVGDILSGVVLNGANSVSQLSFTIDDPEGLQNQARVEAIEKAKEKAKTIAKAGGFSVGRLLGIQEGGVAPVYRVESFKALGLAEDAAPAPAPAIEPGSQEVKVSVTLRYEIR